MANKFERIPYDELANNLPTVFDRVVRQHLTVVVQGEGGSVVMTRVDTSGRSARRRAAKFVADEAIPPAKTYTLEEMAGSVPALPPGRDWRQVERAVKEEKAERLMSEMRQS